MTSDEQRKLMNLAQPVWAVAGSASYIVNGYPETQVGVLRAESQRETSAMRPDGMAKAV